MFVYVCVAPFFTLFPSMLLRMGLEERRYGDYDRARRAFHCASQAEDTYISTWTSWALLEKDDGNVHRACELFQNAAEIATRTALKVPFLYVDDGTKKREGQGQRARRRMFMVSTRALIHFWWM